jgi:exopolysaccharide biosynthesis polyprenyl glycosylphosphotransferase
MVSEPIPHPGVSGGKLTYDRIPRQRVLRRRIGEPRRPSEPDQQEPRAGAPVAAWERHYRRAVIASDLVATATAVGVVGIMLGARIGMVDRLARVIPAVGTIIVVFGALAACRAWRSNVLGQGAEEFRRLGRGLLAGTLVLALIALATDDADGRPWVFLVMPAVALLAMPMRYLLRRALHHYRRDGRCLLPVLAAGSLDAVSDLIERTRRAPHLGWRVEAVCTAGAGGEVSGVPVIGQLDALAAQVRRGGYRIVAVTPDPFWSPNRLRELAWNLEGSETEMVVAPVLMEVAGPRVHVSGVLGMPLLRVSAPAFTGARRVVKGIFDRVAAVALLTVLAPLFLAVAVLIKLDSPGPVLFRQQRIGKNEQAFTMLKFRTMVTDADARRAELQAVNQGAGPLFKLRGDPRITRIGGWLRRYSVDELPQLVNVLLGTMSLVGPRPPLPEETRTYGPATRRRLLVKPGLTGLWQVSGRSDLPWDEAIRLDLRYVEDWSLALDAVILWKTVRAVLLGNGAY